MLHEMKKTENKWGKYLDDSKNNIKNDAFSQVIQKNLYSGALVKHSITQTSFKHHFTIQCINKR